MCLFGRKYSPRIRFTHSVRLVARWRGVDKRIWAPSLTTLRNSRLRSLATSGEDPRDWRSYVQSCTAETRIDAAASVMARHDLDD